MTEVIIICGPSGVGKTTLIRMLLKEFDEDIGFSVSYTTRNLRTGEIAGEDYYYVTEEEFQKKRFYEYIKYQGSGFSYGTSKEEIKRIVQEGKIPLLDVNVKSILQLKQQQDLLCDLIIFIKPPKPVLETLEKRLTKRASETKEYIEKRVKSASEELDECEKLDLRNIIINDDLDNAYNELKLLVSPLIRKLHDNRVRNNVNKFDNLEKFAEMKIAENKSNGDIDYTRDTNSCNLV